MQYRRIWRVNNTSSHLADAKYLNKNNLHLRSNCLGLLPGVVETGLSLLTVASLALVRRVKGLTVGVLAGEQAPALVASQPGRGGCGGGGGGGDLCALRHSRRDIYLVNNLLSLLRPVPRESCQCQVTINIVTEVLGTETGHDISALLHLDWVAGLGDLHGVLHAAQQDVSGETLSHRGCKVEAVSEECYEKYLEVRRVLETA